MSSTLPVWQGVRVFSSERWPEERSCQHTQTPTSFWHLCPAGPHLQPAPAFQKNGITGCHVRDPPTLRAGRLVDLRGIHREQSEQNTSACLLLDCLCALQTPTELSLHLLLIRRERKTRMMVEEFLPASDGKVFGDRTGGSPAPQPPASLSWLISGANT